MHDIGPTARELEYALQEFQPEQFEFIGEDEAAGETAWEGSLQESENFEQGEGYETGFETGNEAYESMETGAEYEAGPYEAGQYEVELYESPSQESEEMELAAELLEVMSEDELDQFIGKLIKRVGRCGHRGGRRACRSWCGSLSQISRPE